MASGSRITYFNDVLRILSLDGNVESTDGVWSHIFSMLQQLTVVYMEFPTVGKRFGFDQ